MRPRRGHGAKCPRRVLYWVAALPPAWCRVPGRVAAAPPRDSSASRVTPYGCAPSMAKSRGASVASARNWSSAYAGSDTPRSRRRSTAPTATCCPCRRSPGTRSLWRPCGRQCACAHRRTNAHRRPHGKHRMNFDVDAATSARMRAVRQADTGPEVRLRHALHRTGLRYRLRRRIAGTRPDVVFVHARVAVFIDGCFWHGCSEHYRTPARNTRFWRDRLASNQARDRRNDQALAAAGWRVIRLWSHDVDRDLANAVARIAELVRVPAPESPTSTGALRPVAVRSPSTRRTARPAYPSAFDV